LFVVVKETDQIDYYYDEVDDDVAGNGGYNDSRMVQKNMVVDISVLYIIFWSILDS